MLATLLDTKDRHAAQRLLEKTLKSALLKRTHDNIGYPGGNSDHDIYSSGPGTMYTAFARPHKGQGIPRHWNSFGFYRPGQRQEIVVEINIPRDREDRRVAGFFARDPRSGSLFLLHSGGIGGGRPGISQQKFLSAIPDRRIAVADGQRVRHGLLIGRLDDPCFVAQLSRFVKTVRAFKQAVADGQPPEVISIDGDLDSAEFYGWKRGTRTPEFDYFSYHGMIVEALMVDRRATCLATERVGRTRLIDLFVARGKRRTEVVEVKTSAGRQSLYTAIGQLMTHGIGDDVKRTLAIPVQDKVPPDCTLALATLKIAIRRYRIVGSKRRARVVLL